MGWMNRNFKPPESSQKSSVASQSMESAIGHLSIPHADNANWQPFQPASLSVSDSQLPFIESSTVRCSVNEKLLWLVIDGVVYDCTSFAAEHPGGADVLEPFRGSDCTWQFWRFHGRNEMEQYGKELRIGRTEGVENKFKERPRFIGLAGLRGADEW